jgi:hypothetical protein
MIAHSQKTITVMQPYFFPYAGYFRLFLEADEFVILDCAQFPRRGWVHRNKFKKFDGEYDWLTLPIEKAPQETLIRDLKFDSGFKLDEYHNSLNKYEIFKKISPKKYSQLFDFDLPVVDLLEHQILHILKALNLDVKIIRSSQLGIDPAVKNEMRIVEIVKILNGNRYVNLSGGINLYNPSTFLENDIQLEFLQPYLGPTDNILERLENESNWNILNEIKSNLRFV